VKLIDFRRYNIIQIQNHIFLKINLLSMNENWLDQIKTAVSDLEVEYNKFNVKGNNSAGTRARKLLQDIKKLAQTGRDDIQTAKAAVKSA